MSEDDRSNPKTTWLPLLLWMTRRAERPHLPPHVMLFSDCLDELAAWTSDLRPYEPGHHRRAWKGLATDFGTALGTVGPSLASTLAPHINELLTLLAFGADHVATTRRADVRRTTLTLISDLSEATAVCAAWNDLVTAARHACLALSRSDAQDDPDRISKLEAVFKRRDLFWSIAGRAGHSMSSMGLSSSILGILNDHKFDVDLALLSCGEQVELGSPACAEPSGLSFEQRLGLITRLLENGPREGHNVVWLFYDHAFFPRHPLAVGPVLFVDVDRILRTATQIPVHRLNLPDELRNKEGFSDELPDGEGIVAVRVEVGYGLANDAIASARTIADGIIGLAQPSDSHCWRRIGHVWHYVDGHQYECTFGGPAGDFDRVGWRLDPTGHQLGELATRVGAHLPSASVELTQALKANLELANAAKSNGLPRLGPTVEIIERNARWAGVGKWYDYATVLKGEWIAERIQWTLHQTVWEALSSTRRRTDLGILCDDIADVRKKVIEDLEGMRYTFNVPDAIAAVPFLASKVAPHLLLDEGNACWAIRLEMLAARLSDSELLKEWIAQLGAEFDTALDRLRRVRDSLSHAGPTAESTLDGVTQFAHMLARTSLNTSLRALLDGIELKAAHDEAARVGAARVQRLQTEGPPLAALYTPVV
jgi:hypothetical protein